MTAASLFFAYKKDICLLPQWLQTDILIRGEVCLVPLIIIISVFFVFCVQILKNAGFYKIFIFD